MDQQKELDYLGVNFAPFVIRDPEKPPENLAYANRVTRERFENRVELLIW